MPGIKVPDSFEKIDSGKSSKEESLLASSQISSFSSATPSETSETSELSTKLQNLPVITPRTDFAIRQANHLVERICRDHGVEAPNYSFAKCLNGQEEQISILSSGKHSSVLRLAEYLHKRGQIERDYATSIQKLNRHLIQTGDTDERLGQLIVMGEKTATGHMDWARKIGDERIVDELKTLCAENEDQRKYLLGELKKLRSNWSKAVSGFEKIRKNRDKALKAADSAQLTLDSALSRGTSSKSTLARLQEDVTLKNERARIAREEYNRALSALNNRQIEIFKEQIPQCFESFEKMERARIAAVRASLISLAQIHMAVADVEIESGQRWLQSLVSLSVDDEIEIFVRSVEERSNGQRYNTEEFNYEEDLNTEGPKAAETVNFNESFAESKDDLNQQQSSDIYGSYAHLTQSEGNLLRVSPDIEEISDPEILKEKVEKLENLQIKLRQQLDALSRMEQAYGAQGADGEGENNETLEAVRMSMDAIKQEMMNNDLMIEEIEDKLSKIPVSMTKTRSKFERNNPMSSILAELNRLDQRRTNSTRISQLTMQQQQSIHQQQSKQQIQKKKALSRSFDDLLNSDNIKEEEVASPKATGLKLPGAQWTAESITRSNEEINNNSKEESELEMTRDGDYFCVEETKEQEEEEMILEARKMFRNRLGSIESTVSTRRKSTSQSTPNPTNNNHQTTTTTTTNTNTNAKNIVPTGNSLIPEHSRELFKVQALYNFIGRKETDELDLRTGEMLSVFDANGEWWEAENEAGIRGYIPFNYVIRL